jgi:hypothetical protein
LRSNLSSLHVETSGPEDCLRLGRLTLARLGATSTIDGTPRRPRDSQVVPTHGSLHVKHCPVELLTPSTPNSHTTWATSTYPATHQKRPGFPGLSSNLSSLHVENTGPGGLLTPWTPNPDRTWATSTIDGTLRRRPGFPGRSNSGLLHVKHCPVELLTPSTPNSHTTCPGFPGLSSNFSSLHVKHGTRRIAYALDAEL